jgi:hypothetical protein
MKSQWWSHWLVCYVHMVETVFIEKFTQFPQVNKNTWFCTARNSVNAINMLLPNYVISRNGEISW